MVRSQARYMLLQLKPSVHDYFHLAGRPDGKDWQESNSVCQPFSTSDGLCRGELQKMKTDLLCLLKVSSSQSASRFTEKWVSGGGQGDRGPGGESAGGAGPACLCYQGSLLISETLEILSYLSSQSSLLRVQRFYLVSRELFWEFEWASGTSCEINHILSCKPHKRFLTAMSQCHHIHVLKKTLSGDALLFLMHILISNHKWTLNNSNLNCRLIV